MSIFDFLKEELIHEDDARMLTEPFHSQIVQVWQRSFSRWSEWPEDDRRRICETPAARPGVLNALAQSFAKELFENREDEGILPCNDIPGVFAFYVEGKVLIRFNILNSSYVVRFDESKPFKRKYLLQEPLPKLNNSADRMTAGYVLDPSKTMIESIRISMQIGQDRVFSYRIDDEDQGIRSLPTPKSAPPLNPPPAVTVKRKPR